MDRRPMAFGAASRRRIADPVFEPLWAGLRTIVVIDRDGVTGHDETGERIALPPDLVDALAAALLADAGALDGYLVPGPFAETAGILAAVGTDAAMKPSEITRQMFLGGGGRNERRELRDAEDARRVAMRADGPVGFVAVDLLEIDGTPLLDVPLQERKRLLDGALADGELVRRTVTVREPVEAWYAQWKAFGFREIAVKGANSRYVPGGRSDDWTTELIPRR
jgi:ATP-dependent DNA ligase